jgi:hypothetical protein
MRENDNTGTPPLNPLFRNTLWVGVRPLET